MNRRLFVTAALTTAALTTAALPAQALARPGALRLRLPAPTGPHRVGTTDLHLVDRDRPDPWVDKPYRELMITIRYPAAGSGPLAPHMRPGAARTFTGVAAEGTVAIPVRIPRGSVDWAATRTHSHAGAAPRGGMPVLLYSHGHLMSRDFGTVLAEELASHGYAVVTVDHTYDPTQVEFPDGRVEGNHQPDPESFETFKRELGIRAVDMRFVLDELESWRGVLDLDRIGIYGHSLGGATAAQSMHDDPRILAGADLDGALGTREDPWGSVTTEGLDRPFLLFTADPSDQNHELVSEFWSHLRGWRRALQVISAAHNTFNDLAVIAPQLRAAGVIGDADLEKLVGTSDVDDSPPDIAAVGAYLRSFFDLHLRGDDDGLLDGPSPQWPQVRFTG
ncbi:hypothetical protein [Saccharopolyspora taberi]